MIVSLDTEEFAQFGFVMQVSAWVACVEVEQRTILQRQRFAPKLPVVTAEGGAVSIRISAIWRVGAKVECNVDVDRLPHAVTILLQFLGEHYEDSAGAAEVREFIDVLIGRHTA